jgi:hypothetical protein
VVLVYTITNFRLSLSALVHRTTAPSPVPKYAIIANETGRCLGLRKYAEGRTVPMLVKCDVSDQVREGSECSSRERGLRVQQLY